MAFVEKMLSQFHPESTGNVSIYSPPENTITIIKSINVCNTDATTTVAYRVIADHGGSVTNETKALYWDVKILPDAVHIYEIYLVMSNPEGNLIVRSDTASTITFTVCGAEIT